jgi:2-keto-4-pentenoate hydratase/2-oxohepta-3-ene-1,7-dioic acid hydratase in catechol pathway
MKLISYLHGDQICVGVVKDQMVIDVSKEFPDMLTIIKAGDKGLEEIKKVLTSNSEGRPLIRENMLAPIPRVERNIICVGWNYLEHFNERFQQDIQLPDKPTVFTKATGTVAGPFETVSVAKSFTSKFDYEAELALVIGVGGKNISENQALDHVYGYMCANDFSARDVQQAHGGQWFLGKSMDKSCPMGPYLITKDEIPDVQNLDITCKVNGVTVQSSNTNLMMFSVSRIISELSQGMTLIPGDIILTGTPPGIGSKRNPPFFLGTGDAVEVSISGVGSIKNSILISNESTKIDS